MKDQTHLMSQPKGDDTWMSKTGGFARDKTLRDYYAGLAMQAIRTSDVEDMISAYDLAVLAYQDADAMLKAREGK
jgi:hypothetical protein